jgi:hypothetical protein
MKFCVLLKESMCVCVFHMIVRMDNGIYLNVFFIFAVESMYENDNAMSVFVKCGKCIN